MKRNIFKRTVSLCLTLVFLLMLVPAASAANYTIKQVESGKKMSFFVTQDGDMYVSGNNQCNILDGVSLSYDSGAGSCAMRPQFMTDNVAMVAADRLNDSSDINHVLILKENGKLYGLGSNVMYQLGSSEKGRYGSMQYIMDDVKYIACGWKDSAAITTNGDLYWWGRNVVSTPTVVATNVKQVECGADHTVILKEDGSVWVRGVARQSALADGRTSGSSEEFIKVMDGCVDISAGDQFAVALKANGDLYGWGNNHCGQLGVSSSLKDSYGISYVPYPTYITSNVREVDCGDATTYLIKNDNSLYGIGLNYDSQLGNASGAAALKPTWLAGNVAQVSAGESAALILKTNGSTYGCGDNYWYQLGAGFSQYNVGTWQPAGFTASPIFEGDVSFPDVEAGSYCYDAVGWAVERYITNGTSATSFSPHNTCTRAQIITFLWRANGCDRPVNSSDLTDVPWYASYYQAFYWARSRGMVAYEGKVNPNGACTRAMAVEFMWKNAGSPAYDTSNLPFTDVKANASYAQAVAWALDQGITTGKTATTFAPNATCTRGQIVTFLYRAMA
ncbi:MAG: S-layer homology domain-containing protein [Oscillospiraceae bacterium]|nr:S-layer homology domain-containing protein [Oscillospiraceae bacterium]